MPKWKPTRKIPPLSYPRIGRYGILIRWQGVAKICDARFRTPGHALLWVQCNPYYTPGGQLAHHAVYDAVHNVIIPTPNWDAN